MKKLLKFCLCLIFSLGILLPSFVGLYDKQVATNALVVYGNEIPVKQEIIGVNKDEINSVCSYDTYYKRTHTLDKEYEKLFKSRKYLDGKRLPSNMYTRIYRG